jgi:hypothetical protein
MTAILLNIDGCEIEHEALMPQEYSEEVMCAGWNPELALMNESAVTHHDKYANDLRLTVIPDFVPDFALPSAGEEMSEDEISFLSAAIPKCP